MARKQTSRQSSSPMTKSGCQEWPVAPRLSRPPAGGTTTSPKDSAKRRTFLLWIGMAVVGTALVFAGGGYLIHLNTVPLPGTGYPTQGNAHNNPGDTHPEYNSLPAMSGRYLPVPPRGADAR